VKIYQAGPLFTQAEQQFNRTLAEALRRAGHEVFLPQEHEQQPVPGYPAKIFASDLRGLDEAGAVVAVLDGSDVDSGTAWECGYAYARAKPIFGLRTDSRIYGTEERINLMVQVPCRVLTSGIEELLQALTAAQRP